MQDASTDSLRGMISAPPLLKIAMVDLFLFLLFAKYPSDGKVSNIYPMTTHPPLAVRPKRNETGSEGHFCANPSHGKDVDSS